jgi:hypothetical protein
MASKWSFFIDVGPSRAIPVFTVRHILSVHELGKGRFEQIVHFKAADVMAALPFALQNRPAAYSQLTDCLICGFLRHGTQARGN